MKVAAVTGAGSGIGRAVAIALALEGYTLALMGRRADALENTRAQLSGTAHICVPTDVTGPGAVSLAFGEIDAALGRIDLLFNNAGSSIRPLLLDETSPEDLQSVIASNATGLLFCAREAFARMRRQSPQGGRIINNGSVSAYAPRPNMTAYTMAKHAVTGLTKSINLDGRTFSIVASQIDIGNAATERTARMETGVLQADGTSAIEPRIALDHVVRSILHIASLPLDANIPFLTIMPATMPLYGRG